MASAPKMKIVKPESLAAHLEERAMKEWRIHLHEGYVIEFQDRLANTKTVVKFATTIPGIAQLHNLAMRISQPNCPETLYYVNDDDVWGLTTQQVLNASQDVTDHCQRLARFLRSLVNKIRAEHFATEAAYEAAARWPVQFPR